MPVNFTAPSQGPAAPIALGVPFTVRSTVVSTSPNEFATLTYSLDDDHDLWFVVPGNLVKHVASSGPLNPLPREVSHALQLGKKSPEPNDLASVQIRLDLRGHVGVPDARRVIVGFA